MAEEERLGLQIDLLGIDVWRNVPQRHGTVKAASDKRGIGEHSCGDLFLVKLLVGCQWPGLS